MCLFINIFKCKSDGHIIGYKYTVSFASYLNAYRRENIKTLGIGQTLRCLVRPYQYFISVDSHAHLPVGLFRFKTIQKYPSDVYFKGFTERFMC